MRYPSSTMRVLRLGSMAIGLAFFACGSPSPKAPVALTRQMEARPRVTPADPTVRPARTLPEDVGRARVYGVERDGAEVVIDDLRLVVGSDGTMLASDERLAAKPTEVLQLPTRLGGGVLFVLPTRGAQGASIWHAERWLGSAREIASSKAPIERLRVGLDRVYVWSEGSVSAIDGASGKHVDLGPLPTSPSIQDVAAADARRAVAIEDLRGVVATFDGGVTWRSFTLPGKAHRVAANRRGLLVGGVDDASWFELHEDGSARRTEPPPPDVAQIVTDGVRGPSEVPTDDDVGPSPPALTYAAARNRRLFGKRPLIAAIEDGWPLADGTAVVARNGALGRVRLVDGALVHVIDDAFSMTTAKCHAVAMPRAGDAHAFGFVCGEPQGPTALYAYDAKTDALIEKLRLPEPRVVTSSGTGALVVSGACPTGAVGGARATPDSNPFHAYCILYPDDKLREIHVHGGNGVRRVTALADGSVVIVSPKTSAKEPARMTILQGDEAKTLPIAFPSPSKELARVLAFGVWLDGFEERRPGVLGGWIEAGDSVVGVELTLDGKAKLGAFIRDTGLTFVGGRYGLGWSEHRESFETTDGGMSWQRVQLPTPRALGVNDGKRACGPVGCIARGWLRVGWGAPEQPERPEPRPVLKVAPRRAPPSTAGRALALTCEPLDPPSLDAHARTHEPRVAPPGPTMRPLRVAERATDLRPFFGHAAPQLTKDEAGASFHAGNLARIIAWGPSAGGWDTHGSWQVQWLPPYAGWPAVRATTPALPPPELADELRLGQPYGVRWQLLGADDSHALVMFRRERSSQSVAGNLLFEIERGRAPVLIGDAEESAFTGSSAAIRAAGAWFLETTASGVTALWKIEDGVAREIARVPRTEGARAPRTTLAKRTDGSSIALVVDDAETRWLMDVNVESGRLGPLTHLGAVARDAASLEACTEDLEGWSLDAPPASPALSSVSLALPGAKGSRWVRPTTARIRTDGTRTCVEALSGTYGGGPITELTRHGGTGPSGASPSGTVSVVAGVGESRQELRCRVRNATEGAR